MSREIDADVADMVLGMNVERFSDGEIAVAPSKENPLGIVLHYSTDIAAAWIVVGKMRADGFNFWLKDWFVDSEWQGFECSFRMADGDGPWWNVSAHSAPQCVCEAALKALKEVE